MVKATARTFTRAQWEEASVAWHDGGFDRDTWSAVRRAAAERGMLYPPAGSKHDDIDAAHPSQRSIVYRALSDTPGRLLEVISQSGSWREVVDALIRWTAARREELDEIEADSERRAEAQRWRDRREAPERLGDIFRRISGDGQ